MMEENKRVARRVIDEIFNGGQLDLAAELIAPEFVGHDPALPEETRGVEGLKQSAAGYRAAFPDLKITIEEQCAEGERVASRWMGRGTHEGELFGIGPTGKQVTVTGITIDRIVEGKIVESWTNWDTFGLMQQLGAIQIAARA